MGGGAQLLRRASGLDRSRHRVRPVDVRAGTGEPRDLHADRAGSASQLPPHAGEARPTRDRGALSGDVSRPRPRSGGCVGGLPAGPLAVPVFGLPPAPPAHPPPRSHAPPPPPSPPP